MTRSVIPYNIMYNQDDDKAAVTGDSCGHFRDWVLRIALRRRELPPLRGAFDPALFLSFRLFSILA